MRDKNGNALSKGDEVVWEKANPAFPGKTSREVCTVAGFHGDGGGIVRVVMQNGYVNAALANELIGEAK